MKLTRRQLNKIILESIDLEKSEPDIQKLTKEQLKKLRGLLMPYFNALQKSFRYFENQDTEEFRTFKQAEDLIETFLEQRDNPGDFPGVLEIYKKHLVPYYYKQIRKNLQQITNYYGGLKRGSAHRSLIFATPKSYVLGEEGYLEKEEHFRKGMEKLAKLYEESDSVAPNIYKEEVLPIAEQCDRYIEEILEAQRSDQHSVDHLLQNYDMTKPGSNAPYYLDKYQEAVKNSQKLLDGESVWIRLKKLIAQYPIKVGKGTKSSVVVQDPLMENKYYKNNKMKLTTRQLRKLILENISEENVRKLERLLIPYVEEPYAGDENDLASFVQGMNLLQTLINDSDGPDPGVLEIYKNMILPFGVYIEELVNERRKILSELEQEKIDLKLLSKGGTFDGNYASVNKPVKVDFLTRMKDAASKFFSKTTGLLESVDDGYSRYKFNKDNYPYHKYSLDSRSPMTKRSDVDYKYTWESREPGTFYSYIRDFHNISDPEIKRQVLATLIYNNNDNIRKMKEEIDYYSAPYKLLMKFPISLDFGEKGSIVIDDPVME